MTAPYSSDEHTAALDKWMDATDKERSEAFYALYSFTGAIAEMGNGAMALRLRALVARLERGELS